MARGKKKYIETPEKLLELFYQYAQDTKENPKYENVLVHKSGEIHQVPRERPLTWWGFENWLFRNGIITRLEHYKSNTEGRYSEYMDIIRTIDQDIYEDKFDGATVGIYQHNIIARDLGLIDKKQVETKDVQPSREELLKEIDEIDNILNERAKGN